MFWEPKEGVCIMLLLKVPSGNVSKTLVVELLFVEFTQQCAFCVGHEEGEWNTCCISVDEMQA